MQPSITTFKLINNFSGKYYFLFAGNIIRYGEIQAFASVYEYENDNFNHLHSKVIKEVGEKIDRIIHCGKNKEMDDVIVCTTKTTLIILIFSENKLKVKKFIPNLHGSNIQTCLFFNTKLVTCSETGEIKMTTVLEKKTQSSVNSLVEMA